MRAFNERDLGKKPVKVFSHNSLRTGTVLNPGQSRKTLVKTPEYRKEYQRVPAGISSFLKG
jgi:hypothetical protein